MADICSVTAPLLLHCPQRGRRVLLQCWPHPRGLVYLEPVFDVAALDDCLGVLEGEVRGEGPWRVGDCVIRVLGCQGTDGEMARLYADWRGAVEQGAVVLPRRAEVRARVAALGGSTGTEPV